MSEQTKLIPEARLETIVDAVEKQSDPVAFCSNTQSPAKDDYTRITSYPQYSVRTDIVNMTRSTLLVTDHANTVYMIPPVPNQVPTGKVIVRKQIMMYDSMSSGGSYQHTRNFVNRQGFETAESRAFQQHYKPNISLHDVVNNMKTYGVTYEIPEETIHLHRSVHHLQSDLVFTTEQEAYSHPNSEHARRQGAGRTVFTQPGISGMTIEIVDNHNEYSHRFVSMGGQAIEIRPHRDAARTHGVHITTMMVTPEGDVRPNVEIVSMDVAREQYGLFSTREEALTWGRTDLSMAVELESLRNKVRTDEQHYQLERARQQRENDEREAQHRETLRALELRYAAERRAAEVQATLEDAEIRKDTKTKEAKLDRKKKKTDHKLDKKSRKVKDHFETRAAVRSDTSSFFKSIPGMVTGAVAVIAVAASLGKWFAGASAVGAVASAASSGSVTGGLVSVASVAGAAAMAGIGKVAGTVVSGVRSIASFARSLF